MIHSCNAEYRYKRRFLHIGIHAFHKKNDPVLNCLQLRHILADFQNFFTLGLSNDCLIN